MKSFFNFRIMFLRFNCILIFALVMGSCNRDHKKEAISNYLNYVWKRQPGEIEIKKLENTRLILGKDSIDLLIGEYAKGINPLPSLDTILNRIENDITYNSNLLAKVKQRIDSIKSQNKGNLNDEFVKMNLKSLGELKDFTLQQIGELKQYRNSFNKYSENRDEVFCYEVLCQYKVKGHASDTTSKSVTQTFFLSSDERKIFMVK